MDFSTFTTLFTIKQTINYSPFLLSFLIFPIYFLVNWQNNSKDQKTAIYLITRHFFKVISFVHCSSYLLVPPVAVILIRTDLGKVATAATVPCLIALIYLIALYLITTSVCSFLIVYLAFHRFLLYFFPSIGELFTIKRTRFFVVCYIFIPLPSFGILYPYCVKRFEAYPKIAEKIWYNPVFVATAILRFFLINVLILLCAILYLIMIWKIKKFKKMMSQTTIKPEKYIMYQVIILSVCQIYALGTFFVGNPHDMISINALIVSSGGTVLSTFPCIQLAYLLCNKENFRKSLKITKRILGIPQVEPIKNLQLTVIRSTSDAS